jgi:hypothetical protein
MYDEILNPYWLTYGFPCADAVGGFVLGDFRLLAALGLRFGAMLNSTSRSYLE